MRGRVAPAVFLATLALLAPAGAGAGAQVRIAAPSDCLTNPNCGPGLRDVYGADVAPVFVPLAVPESGVSALDEGLAEVAVAFSSNPEVSRPDVLVLRDDRGMVGSDNVVPVVRTRTLRAFGSRAARALRRRLDAASAALTTLALRSLNQQVIDGRVPEAVGAEFIDANGLGLRGGRKRGPRFDIGFQAFDEDETLAHLYAEALRVAGFRVRVRPVGGFRAEAVRALRRGRVDMWPGYARSLTEFLAEEQLGASQDVRRPLRRALRRIGARPMRLAQAQNRNLFVMKTDTARNLGVATLSDVARLWPPAAG
jgi:glycine betaine/choline ABC-type transport system substrate-binding protein